MVSTIIVWHTDNKVLVLITCMHEWRVALQGKHPCRLDPYNHLYISWQAPKQNLHAKRALACIDRHVPPNFDPIRLRYKHIGHKLYYSIIFRFISVHG
jgi:hypothetical protein